MKTERNEFAVSSRIRLARNFAGVPFVSRMNQGQKKALLDELHEKVKNNNTFNLSFIDMSRVSAIQAGSMVEEHLISREFAQNREGEALLLSEDKTVSVMLNEEDHLRIQILSPGCDLFSLYEKADKLDDYFDSLKPYAFSDETGYLTSCPTNLGTGMRASVMLHLPALTESGYIQRLVNAAADIGLTFRGMYGEGSRPEGCCYQLSNQISMGISEKDTVDRLMKATDKMTENERKAGEKLMTLPALTDRLYRAYGTMKYCRLLPSAEFMQLYSDLRWGEAYGLFKDGSNELPDLDKLFIKVQPYTLMLSGGEALDAGQRDKKRADTVREAFNS